MAGTQNNSLAYFCERRLETITHFILCDPHELGFTHIRRVD